MGELSGGSFIIGTFNALAFTGTSFLFRSLDKSGYQKEMRRHNRAMEDLAASKEKWYENQVRKKNQIAKLRRDLTDANSDIKATNRSLLAVQRITHNGISFAQEPNIGNFYEPSTEMKDIQYVATGALGLGAGALGAMFLL